MGFFHLGSHHSLSNSDNATSGNGHGNGGIGIPHKRGLASFSFGLNSSLSTKNSKTQVSISPMTKNGEDSEAVENKENTGVASTGMMGSLQGNLQLSSPMNSPVLEDDELASERGSIFERSVQECCYNDNASKNVHPKCIKCCANRSRSCTHNSSISLQSGYYLKNEDYIPPALDAKTLVQNDQEDSNDQNADLNDVEMIYTNRRNSSVIGLNMALGRSVTPSRKGSVYSLHLSSFVHPLSFSHPQQMLSPTSPPKLTSTKSSMSFYSYADMLSNEEKRPVFKSSYSQSFVPVTSHRKQIPSNSSANRNQSLLSKQLSIKESAPSSSNQSFMILPESSDSEEVGNYYPSKETRRSISSSFTSSSKNSKNIENESLISNSVGDCIRQTTV